MALLSWAAAGLVYYPVARLMGCAEMCHAPGLVRVCPLHVDFAPGRRARMFNTMQEVQWKLSLQASMANRPG
jgi:hypothetical protein